MIREQDGEVRGQRGRTLQRAETSDLIVLVTPREQGSAGVHLHQNAAKAPHVDRLSSHGNGTPQAAQLSTGSQAMAQT